MTGNKEHQPLTSGIKHWGLSGYASVLPRIKFGVTGQDSSPQSPTISYRQPLPARRPKDKVFKKSNYKWFENEENKIKNDYELFFVFLRLANFMYMEIKNQNIISGGYRKAVILNRVVKI